MNNLQERKGADLVFVGWALFNRKEKGADLFDYSPSTGLALVLFYLRSAPSNSYRGDSN